MRLRQFREILLLFFFFGILEILFTTKSYFKILIVYYAAEN